MESLQRKRKTQIQVLFIGSNQTVKSTSQVSCFKNQEKNTSSYSSSSSSSKLVLFYFWQFLKVVPPGAHFDFSRGTLQPEHNCRGDALTPNYANLFYFMVFNQL